MNIDKEIQEAQRIKVRTGEGIRLAALRELSAELKTASFRNGPSQELTEAEQIAVIRKVQAQNLESAEMFSKVRDSADNQQAIDHYAQRAQEHQDRADILAEYLPAELTEDQISALVDQAIESAGAQSMKDMGKVMAALKSRADLDMKVVSPIVKSRLS